jgi:integrase/recombinase XerD
VDRGRNSILPHSAPDAGDGAQPAQILEFSPPSVAVLHADSDDRLVELWLHGRNPLTAAAYRADVAAFRQRCITLLRSLTIGELQAFADSLDGASATRRRKLAALKSLLTFAVKIGYCPLNAGAVVRLPAVANVLAEPILTEEQVIRLIAVERTPRNHALLRLLYLAALRVSEVCALRWRSCMPRRGSGQITVIGKRDKVRSVLLPASMWIELVALRGAVGDDDPVFRSRQSGPLDAMSVQRIVKAAARRAGLPAATSPHWLRHAHCSHALERGASPALVRDTAGHADLRTTSVYSHAVPDDTSARFLQG